MRSFYQIIAPNYYEAYKQNYGNKVKLGLWVNKINKLHVTACMSLYFKLSISIIKGNKHPNMKLRCRLSRSNRSNITARLKGKKSS